MALPPRIIRSCLSSQYSFPPLSEYWWAINLFLDKIGAQLGINEQWADPVTGSSNMEACGVKNRESKSTSSPLAVAITPP